MVAYASKKRLAIVLSGIFLIAGTVGIGWHYKQTESGAQQILDFDDARDTQQIIAAFKRDIYWLSANPEHSTEYTLANRASSKKITHLGNLTIKVGYDNGRYAGMVMVAYFKKKFYVGKILYLVVEPEFRSKGWGYRLLDYAVKDLIKRGSMRINLVTRTDNAPGNKLYERYGFEEMKRDDVFVIYNYYPIQYA